MKSIGNCNTFFIFQRNNPCIFAMSITHNKNRNSSLNLPINCMSAISPPQILSINGECTFLLLNFLIIRLCNSSPNFLLGTFSFLIPQPEGFLSKNL